VAARADTRRDVLRAAGTLFAERGYTATTIDLIAETAGVAVQTIYNTLGSKRGILVGLIGGVDGYAVDPRIRREQDPTEIVRIVAEGVLAEHERGAALQQVVVGAAAVDKEIAALERRHTARRLEAYREVARELDRRSALAHGLTVDDAAAAISALASAETYRRLVEEQGWTRERYVDWLERALALQLLAGTLAADLQAAIRSRRL